MKKSELLGQLAEQYESVGTPVLVDNTAGVKTYDVTVFEVKPTGSAKRTVPFYVMAEGTEDEAAYLRVAVQEKTFTEQVNEFIVDHVDETIRKIVAVKVYADFAECNAYTLEDGKLRKKDCVIFKESGELAMYDLIS